MSIGRQRGPCPHLLTWDLVGAIKLAFEPVGASGACTWSETHRPLDALNVVAGALGSTQGEFHSAIGRIDPQR